MQHLRSLGLDCVAHPCATLSLSRRISAKEALPRAARAAKDVKASALPCQVDEWRSLQLKLKEQLRTEDDPGWRADSIARVGGLDISFEVGTDRGTAVLIVCEFVGDGLQLVYEDAIDVDMSLPYVSGFLFVRELPGYQELLRRLRQTAPSLEPDVYLVDGSGVYHPRYFGSASHIGVVEDLRTIGVAKKTMVIEDDFDLDAVQQAESTELTNFGDSVNLVGRESGAVYGMALKTAQQSTKGKGQAAKDTNTRRVYVSVGHRIQLESAKELVLRCSGISGGSYIPEPIRIADLTGRAIERAWQQLHCTSNPLIRCMVLDVSNLLDDSQRRTLHSMLEGRGSDELLSAIPGRDLKRRQQVINELFEPFQQLYGHATVAEVRTAMKMEKPWAVNLKKCKLAEQRQGASMQCH